MYDALVIDHSGDGALTLICEAVGMHPMLPILAAAASNLSPAYYHAGAWAVIPSPIVDEVFTAWLQRAIHISALGRKVARQNEALERYARSFEESAGGT